MTTRERRKGAEENDDIISHPPFQPMFLFLLFVTSLYVAPIARTTYITVRSPGRDPIFYLVMRLEVCPILSRSLVNKTQRAIYVRPGS